MKFLGKGFQKLEHKQDTHTHTHKDVIECITKPRSTLHLRLITMSRQWRHLHYYYYCNHHHHQQQYHRYNHDYHFITAPLLHVLLLSQGVTWTFLVASLTAFAESSMSLSSRLTSDSSSPAWVQTHIIIIIINPSNPVLPHTMPPTPLAPGL